jgi:hypothetical protein
VASDAVESKFWHLYVWVFGVRKRRSMTGFTGKSFMFKRFNLFNLVRVAFAAGFFTRVCSGQARNLPDRIASEPPIFAK